MEQPLGPYVLVERLAAGGMAEVFVAKKVGAHGFEKRLAVKRILPHLAQDAEFVKMFIDEARLAARLEHPNVVQVFDFGEAEGSLFLAMEYVEGITASTILKAAARAKSPVPFPVAAHLLLSVLKALEHAHRLTDESGRAIGLVHRDVTPANMLVARSGEVKLTDFGIARADTNRNAETQTGAIKGKFAYMSPEQALGIHLDHRTDLFSAGVAFVELLMARPLFVGGTDLDILLRVRDGDLTPLWQNAHVIGRDGLEIAAQALATSPDDRFSTATTFMEVVQEALRRRGERADAAALAAWCDSKGLWTKRPVTPQPFSAVAGAKDAALPARGQYRLRMPDGSLRGPMTYPSLVELLTSGEIDSETPISVGGSTFRSLRELTQVTRFITSPGLSWNPEEIQNAAVRGDLSRIGIARLFFRLMSGGETGVLQFWEGARRKKVYFVDGRPEFVGSTDKTELLGEYLVKTGICSREDVDRALADLSRFDGRLDDALVGMGILTSVDLFRAMTAQVRDRLFEMFRWRRGQFAFARGMRSHESAFSLGMEPYAALWQGIVRGYDLEELETMLAPHAETAFHPTTQPKVGIDSLHLPSGALRILRAVDGRSALRAILATAALSGSESRAEALRAVYMGVVCDVVRA